MKIEELVGIYKLKGKNQEKGSAFTYDGTLKLSLREDGRLNALWQISDQLQFGTGFFKEDILVINFYYLSEENEKFKGVAVYRCLDKNTLDGFWSEKHGDPKYLGIEYGVRIHTDVSVN